MCPYSDIQVDNTVTMSSTTTNEDSDSAELEVGVTSTSTGITITTLGVADTGAGVTLAGPSLMRALHLTAQDLDRSRRRVNHIAGQGLSIIGSTTCTLKAYGNTTEVEVFFARGVKRLYVSIGACRKLHLVHPDFPRPPACTSSGVTAETASPVDGDPAQKWETAVVAAARILDRERATDATPVTDHNNLPQEAGRDGEYQKTTWRTPGRYYRTRRARQAVYRPDSARDVVGAHTSEDMEGRKSTWRTPGHYSGTQRARQAVYRPDSARDVGGAHTSEYMEGRKSTPTNSGQRVRVQQPPEPRDRAGDVIYTDGPRQFIVRMDGRVSLRHLWPSYPAGSSPPPRPPDMAP